MPSYIKLELLIKKLLVGINELGQKQASATEDTNTTLLQILYYLSTYLNDGILYQDSGMILGGHSDSAYLNVRKYCSRAGAHIMISEYTIFPTRNFPVFTFTQIFKFVMSSAAKA